jgi:class 3 adenylate cyclase
MFAVDVEGSSGRGDPALMTIRRTLVQALAESVERSGIAWEECLREDLGDGVRLVAPSGTGRAALIHPLMTELGARLRAYNRYAGSLTRIRLRAAVHAGDVVVGSDGVPAGAALVVLARMLDCGAGREALKQEPETTPLVLVISDHVHEETVRHGYPSVDPGDFEPFEIREKEYAARGWLHVPGRRADPVPQGLQGPPSPHRRTPRPRIP